MRATAVLDPYEGLQSNLTSRYGIPFSDKPEVVNMFSQQEGAIETSYEITYIRHIRLSKAQGTLKNTPIWSGILRKRGDC